MLIILRVVDLFLNLMDTHIEHILGYACMCVLCVWIGIDSGWFSINLVTQINEHIKTNYPVSRRIS